MTLEELMVEFLMNHFHSTYLSYNYRIHLLMFEGVELAPQSQGLASLCSVTRSPSPPKKWRVTKIWPLDIARQHLAVSGAHERCTR